MESETKAKKPQYDKIITADQANRIISAISRGYTERDDYPPFALSSIEDRSRFFQYVDRVVRDLAE